VAGALNVQLGGSNIYFGKKIDKPTIGDPLEPVIATHILKTNQLLYLTTFLAAAIGIAIRALA
ncbi:MAG: cobalamin biosynthesis protein, partial [Desulfobulbaceae bacterium]|nr:cobalamin biosynthesis protein [Desulfobulbaceae bacterium]